MANIEIAEPKISRFLFADTRFSWFWLIVRLYVGYEWLMAGWGKFGNPAWTGDKAGSAVKGFLMGALQKSSGAHPDVTGWYASFIEKVALPNVAVISYMVTFGEILIGVGLILGIFTGIAAFFGTFMNLNFLFSGSVSSNPVLLLLQLFLILAWRTAGWIGVDQWLLPRLGTPWQTGKWFK
ncbi:MAG: DoxX family membrane protein [Candidatus Doudnabacteria bacterium]|nr:DoxX family membrane protein [Candidatus Doudnabacteria bacterium]